MSLPTSRISVGNRATGAKLERIDCPGAPPTDMIGVTVFGLLFMPVFYVLCRKLGRSKPTEGKDATAPGPAE